jgi:predicted metal-dependent RNase
MGANAMVSSVPIVRIDLNSSARLSFRPIDQSWLSGLILERKAIHVASPELLASDLSGFFVEPGKTGAI